MLENRIRPDLEENGLCVDFDNLPDFSSDPALPCRLVKAAFSEKKYSVLDEVFSAFFAFGRDITDPAVLKPIAEYNKLPFATVANQPLPAPPSGMPDGLRAVPCLIFNKKSVLFGAQSVPCLKNILRLTVRIEQENMF